RRRSSTSDSANSASSTCDRWTATSTAFRFVSGSFSYIAKGQPTASDTIRYGPWERSTNADVSRTRSASLRWSAHASGRRMGGHALARAAHPAQVVLPPGVGRVPALRGPRSLWAPVPLEEPTLLSQPESRPHGPRGRLHGPLHRGDDARLPSGRERDEGVRNRSGLLSVAGRRDEGDATTWVAPPLGS